MNDSAMYLFQWSQGSFCHISKFSWQRLKNRNICSRQYLYKFPRYTEQYICFYVEALLLPVLYILLGYFDMWIYSYLLVLYLQHCLVNPRWWIIYACHFCNDKFVKTRWDFKARFIHFFGDKLIAVLDNKIALYDFHGNEVGSVSQSNFLFSNRVKKIDVQDSFIYVLTSKGFQYFPIELFFTKPHMEKEKSK